MILIVLARLHKTLTFYMFVFVLQAVIHWSIIIVLYYSTSRSLDSRHSLVSGHDSLVMNYVYFINHISICFFLFCVYFCYISCYILLNSIINIISLILLILHTNIIIIIISQYLSKRCILCSAANMFSNEVVAIKFVSINFEYTINNFLGLGFWFK